MTDRTRIGLLSCMAVFLLAGTLPGEAASIVFTNMVSTGGAFSSPGQPYLEAGNVAYFARELGVSGVYKRFGGLVADVTVDVPGTTNLLNGIFVTSLDGGELALSGTPNNEISSLYKSRGGALTLVANQDTPVPVTGGTFGSIRPASIENGVLAFTAGPAVTQPNTGVYLGSGGALSLVVGTNDFVPNGAVGGKFRDFALPVLARSTITFYGEEGIGGAKGIYRKANGSLTRVVDTQTLIPGTVDTFSGFGDGLPVSSDGDDTAFVGERGLFTVGVYKHVTNQLFTVADKTTIVPGTNLVFSDFYFTSIHNGNVAFTAKRSGSDVGLYVEYEGELLKILEAGDPFDGKTLKSTALAIRATREALAGNQVGFVADFTDNSKGIYVATIMPDDTDGDGMSDAFEQEHFGNPTNAPPTGNPDMDPSINIEEYLADTDPHNSNSFFRIAGIDAQSPVSISFTSSSARAYQVEYAANPTSDVWNALTDPLGGNDGLRVVIDTTNAPLRVYRAKVGLSP